MYFPSLLHFCGISGVFFCVCLSSPPVHAGLAGGVTGLCRAASLIPLCAAVETAPTAWQLRKPGQGEGATAAPWTCCVSPKSLHEAEKGRQGLPVTILCRDLPTKWAGNEWCLALHGNWGPAGKGKRRDSSIFPWLAKGVQLYCDSFTLS